MKTIHHSRLLWSSVILFAAVNLAYAAHADAGQNAPQTMAAPMGAQAAPAPGQMPEQAPPLCGNQPLCYETSDFAATITDFRTSTQSYFRVIDVVVRFQNKTNAQLGFAYTQGSGIAMDDRGNRYIVYGGNGTLGIGNVIGNNFDPKFELRPGGYGDARFELMWNPPAQSIIGSTFELDLTVREINTVEGNQHTLGGEFPLIYKGLTNGVTASAPAMTAGAPGGMPMMASGGGAAPAQMPSATGQAAPACGPASTATAVAGATNSAAAQNAAATANTTVSNATAALSNLGSIFGKKKPAAAPPPCPPGTNPVAGAVTNAAGTVAGAAPAGAVISNVGSSLCAGKPHCSETPDFAATITSFRTAAQGNTKVVDAVVHFQNKTNSPLILGYVLSTGTATDDRGNRYVVYGGNGFTGIGYVNGGNFDPRFVVQPGGFGDARFELIWNPPAQANAGSNFELDVAVNEINTVQGNQHTLGGQFPLRFPGLTNGLVAAAAPAAKSAATTTPAAKAPAQAAAPAAKKAAATPTPKKP
jgi:hypothetical protein